MKLLITLFFTLMLAMPVWADDARRDQTGETATPAAADPCSEERVAEGLPAEREESKREDAKDAKDQ